MLQNENEEEEEEEEVWLGLTVISPFVREPELLHMCSCVFYRVSQAKVGAAACG